MDNIRRNGIVGVIEQDGLQGNVHTHFSEWWNGEGLDFQIETTGEDQKKISLHLDELHTIVVAAAAAGMVDLKSAYHDAEKLNQASEKRAQQIKKWSEHYSDKYQSIDPNW